jgi:hypothetical protein
MIFGLAMTCVYARVEITSFAFLIPAESDSVNMSGKRYLGLGWASED